MESSRTSKNYIIFWIIGFIVLALLLWFFVIKESSNVELEIGNSAVLGDANAPVTIYEFSDFSCPYCAAAAGYNEGAINLMKGKYPGWQPPIPLIIENYVKTGKAKIVFKYYPGHGTALNAHAMALALKEQNSSLFWSFADKAFAQQASLDDWDSINAIAASTGADMNAAAKSMKENNYALMLKEEFEMGQSAKVDGTPTFIIGREIIKGPMPFSVFKEAIEKELKLS